MTFAAIVSWLLSGLNVTCWVTLYTAAVALAFALPLGIAEYMLRGWLRLLVTGFIDFWRGSSVVILLFFFYYVLPAFDIQLNAFTVAALVIGCNIGAYASQALRAALESTGQGQIEAGR